MKSIFSSKTFWFGTAQVVFAAVGYFTGWIDQQAAYALFVTGISSIGLRFKTTTPVSVTGR